MSLARSGLLPATAVVVGGLAAGITAYSGAGLLAVAFLVIIYFLAAFLKSLWHLALVGVLASTTLANSQFASLVPGLDYIRFACAVFLAVLAVRGLWRVKRQPTEMGLGANGSLKLATIFGVLFVAIAALSVTVSSYPSVALAQLVMLMLLATVGPAAAARWASNSFYSDLYLIHNFLTLTFIVGLLLPTSVSTVGGLGRFAGIYSNPNGLGIMCSLVVPLSVFLWTQGRRLAAMIGVLTSIASIVLAQSRTPVIALVGGLIVVLLLQPTVLRVLTGVAITAVGSSGWLILGRQDSIGDSAVGVFMQRFSSGGDDALLFSEREGIWSRAFETWIDQPFLGYGYGTAPTDSIGANGEFIRGIAANSYVQVLVEMGIFGAVALLMTLSVFLYAAMKLIREGRYVSIGYFILVGLAAQFTESALFGAGQAYPWVFWFVAFLGVCCTMQTPSRGKNLEPSNLPDIKRKGLSSLKTVKQVC